MVSQIKLAKPQLASGYKLQFEKKITQFVLLYPEGMIKLNDSAAIILQHCNGLSTIQEIIRLLQKQFPENDIQNDICNFLETAYDRGWIR